jgi:drug/metabolite transporter (DMT)-like permease
MSDQVAGPVSGPKRSGMVQVLLILGAAALFTLCDSLAADWGRSDRARSLVLVLAVGPVAYLLFGYLARHTPLALVSGYVNVTMAVGTMLVGVLVFGDVLSARQWCGIGLAVGGLVLLSV